MKKTLLLFTLIFLAGAGAVQAAPFSINLTPLGWEADTADGVVSEVPVSELLNITNAGFQPPVQVTQKFTTDGVLNDGDTFTETGFLNFGGVDGPSVIFRDANSKERRNIYIYFENLSGSIADYSNGGDGDTTPDNFQNTIANDTFNLVFDTGLDQLGTIMIFADDNLSPADGATELATLMLLAGDGIAPQLSAGALPNGTFNFTAEFDQLLDGVWSFEGSPNVVLGLADVNAGLQSISRLPESDDLLLEVENSGTLRAVPIPSALLLLGGGLLGLVGFRRIRKN